MPYANRDQQREYQKNWLAKRRADWITAHGPCVNCGSYEDLEVDHIDPATKTLYPREIWSARAEIRIAELAKYQVLCRTCHYAKTGSEKRIEMNHGDYQMYGQRKCRCALCRAASARYKRELRQRHRDRG